MLFLSSFDNKKVGWVVLELNTIENLDITDRTSLLVLIYAAHQIENYDLWLNKVFISTKTDRNFGEIVVLIINFEIVVLCCVGYKFRSVLVLIKTCLVCYMEVFYCV